MRKSDKKMEKQLRVTLTNVCDTALKEFKGFQWLTHLVNYDNFPKTLKIVCIFDTNDNLSTFLHEDSCHQLCILVQKQLFEIGISLKGMNDHLVYDTEENCESSHQGNWANKLKNS
jgi:hypothetical protein